METYGEEMVWWVYVLVLDVVDFVLVFEYHSKLWWCHLTSGYFPCHDDNTVRNTS